jgi:gas vesicle protein
MSKGNIVIGALAGVAAGAILGLILAPEKGSKTRKKIARLKSQSADDVKHKVDDIIHSATERFESLKKEAFKMRDKISTIA